MSKITKNLPPLDDETGAAVLRICEPNRPQTHPLPWRAGPSDMYVLDANGHPIFGPYTTEEMRVDSCRRTVAAVNQHAALLAEVATLKAQRDALLKACKAFVNLSRSLDYIHERHEEYEAARVAAGCAIATAESGGAEP